MNTNTTIPTWTKVVLLLSGIYNLVWGGLVATFPTEFLALMLGTVFIAFFTDNTPFTSDTLLALIGLPILLAFVVAVMYPILLIPALLILILKQNYGDKPMLFFFLSTVIGGLILSLVSLEIEYILTGMFFALLSVLTQYYYFDKKREVRSSK